MGHKVHPNGFRLGVYRNWEAKWFATDKEFKPLLLEDVRLRRMLMIRLKNAGLARIETERSSSALTITLHTAKPGIVIGKGGTSVDQLRDELEKITGKRVRVTIQEIKKPELSAQLVAENVAAQLEKRIAFRRAIKQSLMKTMRAGAQGGKIRGKGRLGGSEMARGEWNREGGGAVHTPKADSAFGQAEAHPHSQANRHRRGGRETQANHSRQNQHRGEGHRAKDTTRTRAKEEGIGMLLPARVKYRKVHRGRRTGLATQDNDLAFGEVGLQASEAAWMSNRQIEAARRVMTRFVRRGGQVFIRVFPDKSV